MFHPATLLLVWAEFALVLPLLPLAALAPLLLAIAAAAWRLAPARTGALLRRARWLLLSVALLFAFATPGLALPGVLGQVGMTQDGLMLAAEHLSRLLLLLATLALLHERLGTAGFVGGLHWLLGPLPPALRQRIVVRLMLVIEYVDNDRRVPWREWLAGTDDGPQTLSLAAQRPGRRDWVTLAIMAASLGALAW